MARGLFLPDNHFSCIRYWRLRSSNADRHFLYRTINNWYFYDGGRNMYIRILVRIQVMNTQRKHGNKNYRLRWCDMTVNCQIYYSITCIFKVQLASYMYIMPWDTLFQVISFIILTQQQQRHHFWLTAFAYAILIYTHIISTQTTFSSTFLQCLVHPEKLYVFIYTENQFVLLYNFQQFYRNSGSLMEKGAQRLWQRWTAMVKRCDGQKYVCNKTE